MKRVAVPVKTSDPNDTVSGETVPRTRWYLSVLTVLVALAVAFLLSEALCRLAGAGRIDPILTGPKQLFVPDPDPRIAFRMRPGYSDFVYGAQVTINSRGLRDREYAFPPKAGTRRILILGDSVAFGYAVPVEETFAKQWERRLNEDRRETWEVVNAAVPAYNTVQEVRWLEVEGLRYRPEAVVLTYVMNDPEVVLPLREDGEVDLSGLSQFYLDVTALLPNPLLPGVGHSRLLRFIDRRLIRAYADWTEMDRRVTRYFCRDVFRQPGWDPCKQAFLRLQRLCRKENLFLLVAVYPNMYRLSSFEDHPFIQHYERIKEFMHENGIACVAPLEDYIGQPASAMRAHPDDPHPGGKSHAIFARRLHEEFLSKSLKEDDSGAIPGSG